MFEQIQNQNLNKYKTVSRKIPFTIQKNTLRKFIGQKIYSLQTSGAKTNISWSFEFSQPTKVCSDSLGIIFF